MLIPITANSATPTTYSREQIKPIVLAFEDLNDKCKGGSGDAPATWVSCKKRDDLFTKIKNAGWCWGDGTSEQIESDKQWQMCTSVPGESPELWPIPKFNVNAMCEKLATSSGKTSEMVRQGCYQQEQASYNTVKNLWMKIPLSMQEECVAIAKASGSGSYMVLDGCITQEMSSKDSNENFQFKY